MSGQEFPELACYGMAGHGESPRDVLDEVQLAEQLGIGSMLLSERFNVKDAGVLAAASRTIGIGTAATNHNTRYPLVTATMAATAHRLSGGRYALGLGRGFGALFEVMGLPKVTGAQLRDVVGLYRVAEWSLAAGERFALLHGDYRLDNLTSHPGTGEVRAVDWQTLSLGLPARDLAYLISTGMTPDDRRRHERDLVAAYHRGLPSHGVTGHSLETCWRDYRLAMLQATLVRLTRRCGHRSGVRG